jgi:hypothetical protein
MTKKPRSLLNVVENGEQLGHLARMLHQQEVLLKQIRQIVPGVMQQHCLHARICGNRLILHTDSPVWATRLRFHGNEIINTLRQQAPAIRKLDIRIMLPEPVRPGRPALGSLPEKTALLIGQLADSIDDEAIQAALKRLCYASTNKEN